MSFENSKQYLEAKQQWIEETYKDLLNPTNVIICNEDEVYLFYPQDKVEDIFKTFCNIRARREEAWENNTTPELDIYIGCDEPKLENYTFMGKTYKAIYLWYDNYTDAIPDKFQPKQ